MTDTSTAIQKARPHLTADQVARIEERRLQSAMVQKIRGATWGQQWDANTIAAVATWARENDVDPITEIDVLGGNIYIKSRYYEKILSRLIGLGHIDYARADWVHVDKRLEKMADAGDEAAKRESRRRLNARIAAALSDEADFACVYRIKHRLMTEEITGAKEHVPGKRKDPVGDAMPQETIETRAIRRAMLKLKEALGPEAGRVIPATSDEDFVEVGEVVKDNHARLKEQRQIAASPVETEVIHERKPEPAELVEDDDDMTDTDVAAQDERDLFAKRGGKQ